MNTYKDEMEDIAIVINLGVTDYYFVNFLVFIEYKKFNILLTERTAKKRMSFIIVG